MFRVITLGLLSLPSTTCLLYRVLHIFERQRSFKTTLFTEAGKS